MKTGLVLVALLIVTGATCLMAPASQGSDAYVATDLGALGGTIAAAFAINNSGQVVGYAFDAGNNNLHPVLFSGTGSNNKDLGGLNGETTGSVGRAYDINDAGVIVGIADVNGFDHPVRFSGTGTNNTQLDVGNPGNGTAARAVNQSGQIVGNSLFSMPDGDVRLATLFSGTGSGNTDLGVLNGPTDGYFSIAYAVNKTGAAVGHSVYSGLSGRATLFSGGNVYDLGSLTTAANNSSYAYSINDAGVMVGGANLSAGGKYHAVRYSGTGSDNVDLGSLGGNNSYAFAINNAGVIVGNSQVSPNSGTYHAFIYKDGVMTDVNTLVLNPSGFTDIRVNGDTETPGRCLNESGQIAAVSSGPSGTHAVLLTPYHPQASAVSKSGNSITVTFNAIAGKTYRLESAAALTTTTNWQMISGVSDFTAPTTGSAQITGPTAGSSTFYRVRLLL
jgi:probable HAF family extracellular repeat protein